MGLKSVADRIYPSRGLVATANRRGKPLTITAIHRWMRLSRVAFNVPKLDLLVRGTLPANFRDMVCYGRELCLDTSLRTDCATPPPPAEELNDLGLFDVLLAPDKPDSDSFHTWLNTCHEARLSIRVQLAIPSLAEVNAEDLANTFRTLGVVALTLMVRDEFMNARQCPSGEASTRALDNSVALANHLRAYEIEVNLYGVPTNAVPAELTGHVGNSVLYFRDHQQYSQQPFEFAVSLYDRKPYIAGKILYLLLARHMIAQRKTDELVLQWLFLKHRIVLFWVFVLRKWTRDWPFPLGLPRRLEKPPDVPLPPGERISGIPEATYDAAAYKRYMPGLSSSADDWAIAPEWRSQPKHYDRNDAVRVEFDAHQESLATTAREITSNRAPDSHFEVSDYGAENTFFEPLSGANRWFSITRTEKLSNPVAWIEPPLTLAVTFGGGYAEFIGFAVGKFARIVCPMVHFSHRLILHIAPDGSYALLRDSTLVHPIQFESKYFAPVRIPHPLPLRLALWNIDEHISTQTIDMWRADRPGLPNGDRVKYSVVIFSTRFSRRLQAVLQSLVHQEEIAPELFEVIVGYVPAIDATDDVIDSICSIHPTHRVVRVPFPEQKVISKGYVINECCRLASGEWIIVLDSDTLLPPRFLSELACRSNDAVFLAPEGRGMLSRKTTAGILLGEIRPWQEWDRLICECDDFRTGEAEGIPIGFCQIFKKSCLEEVSYKEFEHFEGADSDFGLEMREKFGPEKRMDGVPVLHLDHGGSQWFGTYKQM